MSKKLTILWLICIAMFMAGSGTMWGQYGVLAPQKHVHSHECNGSCGDAHLPSKPAEIYYTDYSNQKEGVSLRRDHAPGTVDTIRYAQDVQGEFGAGESSRISPAHQLLINAVTAIPFTGATHDAPAGILLGSQNSKNVVIKTYSGAGFAMGWMSVLNAYRANAAIIKPAAINSWQDVKNIPGLTYYDEPHAIGNGYNIFSFNKYNRQKFVISNQPGYSLNPWNSPDPTDWSVLENNLNACDGRRYRNQNVPSAATGPAMAPCQRSLFELHYYPEPNGKARMWIYHHTTDGVPCLTVGPSEKPRYYYTSSISDKYTFTWPVETFDDNALTSLDFPMDDGIPLVQINGTMMKSSTDLSNQVKMASVVGTEAYSIAANSTTDMGANAANSGAATMANYKRPTTVLIEKGDNEAVQTFDEFTYRDINWWYTTDTVYPQLGSQKVGSSSCGSGEMTFITISPEWRRPADPVRGSTFIDGAIVIAAGAHVCVKNNVKDATAVAATSKVAANPLADEKTDALLVLPNDGRSTLRVGGDIDSINIAHDATLPFIQANNPTNKFYTQATFPVSATNIYSYPAGASFGNGFTFAPNSLGGFTNAAINVSLPALPVNTEASVLGVNGNYNYKANNAEWHTNLVPGGTMTDHPGVIEIGTKTRGSGHMHIYSGGMLKNFESCIVNSSFPMHLGCPSNLTGDAAASQFVLNGTQPLHIMNYGVGRPVVDACLADLYFYKAATDSIANAFTNATDDGIMRIQALSDAELRADATIDATPRGNNLYILSEGGNVVTQKFNYKGDHKNTLAQGLLTLWAEDRQPELFGGCANDWATNRNSNRGNVYINDSIKVNRPAAPAPGNLNTETNMIAANNIRTASFEFESQNQDHDTTNIISRKGDIWLGYSIGAQVYDAVGNITANTYKFSDNKFTYKVNDVANAGVLNIKAGWDETDNGKRWEGGNIYFTSIKTEMIGSGAYPTNITIPFSNEYYCGSSDPVTGDLHERRGEAMQRYEHAGIIGGVGRCGREQAWNEYEGKFTNPIAENLADQVIEPALKYQGNNGDLTVDAGQRGNIIMNTGTEINFQNDKGSAFFRTRFGDIDLRGKTNIRGLKGNLLLLAQTENLSDLSKVGLCGCAEERNNVYVQDMAYTPNDSGSIFIAADNNIKLNYGGLQNKGTRHDPFLSTDYNPANPDEKIGTDYPCGTGKYHCDMVDNENQARELILNFSDTMGMVTSFNKGGFAAVASDYIDVYKKMEYKGGQGAGIGSVPGTGTLHGENVAGYGLYMKTQGNKNNWNTNTLKYIPKCPMGCEGGCDKGDFLHMVSRMTFHSDARIYAHDQKVYLGSPVIEVFGDLELNTKEKDGTRTEIVLQADSLILHDSLIVSGDKLKYRSWSGVNGDKPIMKFGYSRRTPPVQEYKYKDIECAPCYSYIPGSTDPKHMLDTITIKFKYGDTFVERFNTVVFDHTVLTFVTDSFDHVQGPPILNARFFIDTLKVRNQVALYADARHEHDAHFELISEEQMQSKNYAGVYTRHYHMEPIGACGRNYSELWLSDDKALDVITTSTFGGFGYQHSDVHVETEAHLNPGFTSLRLRGQCYEQKCGTLKMKDLRLDGGAQLHFSVGTTKGINGEYSDAIDVDMLTTYGTVDVNIEVRPCERMENRCYPIIYYKSQTPGSVKNLNLVPKRMKINGMEVPLALDVSQEGVVYLCVGNAVVPKTVYSVTIPSVVGVTTTPPAGIAYTLGHSNFEFRAKYSTEKPFVVRTDRMYNGLKEVLEGKKNANGEYEYVITDVTQHIVLTFGPDHVANMSIDGPAVWSHGETIYIRVEREDIASIYSVAGQLVKRIELPEGDTPIPMQRGAYVVTLKDGTVHKVIVK
ncbi:hypothetical protein [Tannerella sp.]|uniref:hypothetical protein n=1 Tax=Tannerella sp. TaxID=2382127 RepID=UPI003FA3317C